MFINIYMCFGSHHYPNNNKNNKYTRVKKNSITLHVCSYSEKQNKIAGSFPILDILLIAVWIFGFNFLIAEELGKLNARFELNLISYRIKTILSM